VALLLVVLLVVARPFFVAHFRRQGALSERQALEAQKEVLVSQIRELDFDHETGKVPEDVYERERSALMVQAAALLQQIDRLQSATPAGNGAPDDVDREIEEAVRRLRRVPVAEGEYGVAPAAVRKERGNGQPPAAETGANGAERFCPHCGNPREQADRYCAFCGQRLA
jgi:hypothetical protein